MKSRSKFNWTNVIHYAEKVALYSCVVFTIGIMSYPVWGQRMATLGSFGFLSPSSGGGGGSWSGGTVTQTIVFDGVNPDIETGPDEDFTIAGNGTGRMVVGRQIVVDDDPGFIVGGTTFGQESVIGGYIANSYGFLGTGVSQHAIAGMVLDLSANAKSFCTGDNWQPGASVDILQCFYGEGMRVVEKQQTITIADDGAGTSPTSSTAPTSEHIEIDCQDSNGCNWAPDDIGTSGSVTCAVVLSTNTVTVSDASGTIAVPGASVVLGQHDTLCLMRTSTGIWVSTSTAANN